MECGIIPTARSVVEWSTYADFVVARSVTSQYCFRREERTRMTSLFGPLTVGFLIGAVASLVGGFLSYWTALRETNQPTRVPVIMLFLIVFVLGIIGALVITVGLFAGKLGDALLTGVGVLLGFSGVFALLLALWLRAERR